MVVLWIMMFPQTLSSSMVDIVRASTILVAMGWVCGVYLMLGFPFIIQVYQSLFPWMTSVFLILVVDACAHLLPAFIMKWPKRDLSFISAQCLIIGWYTAIRPFFSSVYAVLPEYINMDNVMYLGMPLLVNVFFVDFFNTFKRVSFV
jgi:hypothetical protein